VGDEGGDLRLAQVTLPVHRHRVGVQELEVVIVVELGPRLLGQRVLDEVDTDRHLLGHGRQMRQVGASQVDPDDALLVGDVVGEAFEREVLRHDLPVLPDPTGDRLGPALRVGDDPGVHPGVLTKTRSVLGGTSSWGELMVTSLLARRRRRECRAPRVHSLRIG
jgi:hypothetical protein